MKTFVIYQEAKIIYSPIYSFNPTHAQCSAEISTKVLFLNSYDIKIYTYQGVGLDWIAEEKTITFGSILGQQRHLLFTATAGRAITGLALEFLSSSTGQKDLYYTIKITGDLEE